MKRPILDPDQYEPRVLAVVLGIPLAAFLIAGGLVCAAMRVWAR